MTINFERGYVYYGRYSAKYKEILPIWDKKPLIYVLSVTNRHLFALNLHWIPLKDRVRFVGYLDRASKRIKNPRIFVRWTWKLIQQMGHAKKLADRMIRQYIKKRFSSAKLISRQDISSYTLAIKWRAAKVKGGPGT